MKIANIDGNLAIRPDPYQYALSMPTVAPIAAYRGPGEVLLQRKGEWIEFAPEEAMAIVWAVCDSAKLPQDHHRFCHQVEDALGLDW